MPYDLVSLDKAEELRDPTCSYCQYVLATAKKMKKSLVFIDSSTEEVHVAGVAI